LALQAGKDFNINLRRSYTVGDKVEDVLFGRNIRATPILVMTGSGRESLAKLKDLEAEPALVAEDIRQAVEWILEREKIIREK
jgi:histidinol phosphatase-like enzyme